MDFRKLLAGCTLVFLSQFTAPAALAQSAATYPNRPVTFINPFPAGGPVDHEFRLYTNKLQELLGQPFLLDFKPGAEGAVGAPYVAHSKPDGYTLLIVSGGLATIQAVNPDLPFDLAKDFAAVSLINKRDQALVAYPGFPIKTLQEYFAYARAHPKKVNMSNSGMGGTAHLATSWLHNLAGVQVTYIPYKGAGPQIVDLVAGRVDVSVAAVLGFLPHIKSGKLNAIAIMGKDRSKMLPNVPTVAEQGVPGYDYSNWMGVVFPAGTPEPVVGKLNEALVKTARAPEVAGPLENEGIVMVGSSAPEFQKMLASEVARWRKVVKDNNIKVEK